MELEIDASEYKDEDILSESNYVNQELLSTHKAGMEGFDKAAVAQIIHEASKESVFHSHQADKIDHTTKRIEEMKIKYNELKDLDDDDIYEAECEANEMVSAIEETRDLSRTIFHVDMDCFYAAVEIRENPSLKGKPVGVGSNSMLCTASYEARKFGCRAAMPGFIAKKLCPDIIIVPNSPKLYYEAAMVCRSIFAKFDTNFRATSLDEAYLDVTGFMKENVMSCLEAVEMMRAEIETETKGLTCSVGVAPNMRLAKICSDLNKPNGHYIIDSTKVAVTKFAKDLQVRKIGGIGKVSERVLKEVFSITTCGELMARRGILRLMYNDRMLEFFMEVALGMGCIEVRPREKRKSISAQETFRPISSMADVEKIMYKMATRVAKDMARENICGTTVSIMYKTTAFKRKTKAMTVKRPVHLTGDLYAMGMKLASESAPFHIRLLGLRVATLRSMKHSTNTMSGFLALASIVKTVPNPPIRTSADSKQKETKKIKPKSKIVDIHNLPKNQKDIRNFFKSNQ